MKRKTYNNFMKTIKAIEQKGYSFEESKNLAHKVWENTLNDGANRSAEYFISKIISKADYIETYMR